MHLEEALEKLGGYGRYQIRVWLLVGLLDSWTSAWHMFGMTFLGFEPDHHCKLADGKSLNRSIPYETVDGKLVLSKCEMYSNLSRSNATQGCDNGWVYSADVMQSSIVTQWDLVCDKNTFAEAIPQSIYMAGLMMGAFLLGPLGDRFGRKKIMYGSLLCHAMFGSAVAFAPNIYVFLLFRFLLGISVLGANAFGFIIACEIFPSKQRSILGVVHEVQWTLGTCFLPLIAYLFRYTEWRYLQLALALPALLGFVTWRWVPESIAWLISRGRITEAEAILKQAAHVNKTHLPDNCLHSEQDDKKIKADEQSKSERTYTLFDLFKTPRLRRITICACICWFANVMVYYGISQNTPNLNGNMYLNFFLSGVVETPSLLLCVYLLYKIGRRWPMVFMYFLSAAACIIVPWIPADSANWAIILFVMIGKFSINTAFTISMVYCIELFPTVVRATGYSFANVFGRISGTIYPYILYINKREELGNFRFALPYIILCVVAIGAGICGIFLPETQNRQLPDTIDDVEGQNAFPIIKRSQTKSKGQVNAGFAEPTSMAMRPQ